MQGKEVEELTVKDLKLNDLALIGSGLDRRILIFWATWCGPCKTLLDHLAKKAAEGELPASKIFLVSSSEDREVIKKTVEERSYPFTIAMDMDGSAFRQFNVDATPTTFFIDEENRIEWSSVGFNPLAASRASEFLVRSR